MAFGLNLYDCSSDARALNKILSGGITVSNVRPTGIVDLMAPTFELDYNSAYATKNYCIAGPPFNRSYFITDMKIDIGKKIIISCAVDVLGTYNAGIKDITANIVRQENLIKDMLPDPSFVYINEHDVITKLITKNGDFSGLFDSNVGKFTIVLGISGAPNNHVSDVDGYTLLTGAPADWSTRFMFYWVNTGNTSVPIMESIGQLIFNGIIPQNPSYNDIVAGYGGVYSKDMVI